MRSVLRSFWPSYGDRCLLQLTVRGGIQVSSTCALRFHLTKPDGEEVSSCWLVTLSKARVFWAMKMSETFSDVQEICGIPVLGKVFLDSPPTCRPLLWVMAHLHEAVAAGTLCVIACSLLWACGNTADAYIVGHMLLGDLYDACNCHGLQRRVVGLGERGGRGGRPRGRAKRQRRKGIQCNYIQACIYIYIIILLQEIHLKLQVPASIPFVE